jgi:hypothetical protein
LDDFACTDSTGIVGYRCSHIFLCGGCIVGLLYRLLAVMGCTLAAVATSQAQTEKRVALVIGNAGYQVGPLRNPVNDATAVAELLEKRLGFKIILKRNLGFEAFRAALFEFSREAAGAEVGLVYFAGHGTEVNGRNFLIPVDAKLAKAGDLDLEAVALDTVLAQLAGVRQLKLVILDACRNNVFALAGGKRSVTRGLGRIEPEENSLVVYAAKDGTTAEDGTGQAQPVHGRAADAHRHAGAGDQFCLSPRAGRRGGGDQVGSGAPRLRHAGRKGVLSPASDDRARTRMGAPRQVEPIRPGDLRAPVRIER